MDYITYAIPVFFLLIGVELLVQRLRNTQLYRLNDAVANINCGIVSEVTKALFKTVLVIGYLYIFEHWRLFDIPNNALTFFLLFIGIDFFYYWFHRLSHEINLLWGAHIVHHQSEDYNFSVALRQSSFQSFFSFAFYLPLAFIGFDPVYFITISSFQTLYQFWIHTKTIGVMPAPFEYVFNTPSHHRVHHGRNPKYIDKNHGGTLIIFDRMFGTFQREEEEVVYGVTKPLNSWNALWANFDYYKDLWSTFRQARGIGDKVAVLFKPPGWRPDYLGGPEQPKAVDAMTAEIFTTRVSNRVNYYVLGQFVLLLVYVSFFLFMFDQYSYLMRGVVSLLIIITVVSLGRILEARSITWLEVVRQPAILASLYFLPLGSVVIYALSALTVLGILWFVLVKKEIE